jgi:DNA mismatch repair protein MutS
VILDSATLRDLDVVSASTTGGPTLLGLVDRTRTRIGREHLRRHLTAPPHAVEAILARQHAHRSLAAEASRYRAILDRVDLDAIERYLRSNWQLPDARRGLTWFAGGFWRPEWYQQYLTEIGQGRTRIIALLDAANELRMQLGAVDPALLRDVSARLTTQLAARDVLDLLALAHRGSASTHEAFDQLARGRGMTPLIDIVDSFGSIEAMWSLATATVEHEWCYPRPGSSLNITGLFHPFLGPHAVRNDLQLDDAVRVCFVTGPNMAGKSTFLKAMATAVLLAHCGCGVPAAAMEFPPVGTIFSSVQITDNLSAGESFYLAEVRRMRALAVALRDNGSAVAVIDEPFRGTNVHDAADATLAVITRLAAHPRMTVMIASHLAEIVPAVVGDPRVRLLHFAADVIADEPRFDYQLRPGMSTQRLGMTLLKQEQVLDLLEQASATG